jgi:hypothetical protein
MTRPTKSTKGMAVTVNYQHEAAPIIVLALGKRTPFDP